MINKKEKIQKAAHLFAGLLILFHSYEKYESGHASYIYFLIAGIVFINLAVFHHILKAKYRWIDSCFYLIEAILSVIIAFEYFHLGKKGLPFAYLLAAIFQVAAIYFLGKRRTVNQPVDRIKQTSEDSIKN